LWLSVAFKRNEFLEMGGQTSRGGRFESKGIYSLERNRVRRGKNAMWAAGNITGSIDLRYGKRALVSGSNQGFSRRGEEDWRRPGKEAGGGAMGVA